MVTETFRGWRRRCWQTSHCTVGQWHSLWALADIQHWGCRSWALTTRTRTRITLLSLHDSSHRDIWQPWLIWPVWGQGGFGHYITGVQLSERPWRAYIMVVVQVVINLLVRVFIGWFCSMIDLWLLLKLTKMYYYFLLNFFCPKCTFPFSTNICLSCASSAVFVWPQ